MLGTRAAQLRLTLARLLNLNLAPEPHMDLRGKSLDLFAPALSVWINLLPLLAIIVCFMNKDRVADLGLLDLSRP